MSPSESRGAHITISMTSNRLSIKEGQQVEEEEKKGKAEETVEKTGEVIGKGVGKGVDITKGFGKGLKKGFKKEE